MSLWDSLRPAKLIVTLGPGGVGKTTVSAALAAARAREGQRALVITIDPARRLGSVLGLDPEAARQAGPTPVPVSGGGTLHALMLDTKPAFDALVSRITGSKEREQILKNPMYQSFSQTLARSHAYVSMEHVLWALDNDEFDLVVLDCPPSAAAVEILDAPARLVRLLRSKTVKALVQAGTHWPLSALRNLTGETLLQEMSSFFALFAPLAGGFKERAERVQARFARADTRFILVTLPEFGPQSAARELAADLLVRSLKPSLLVFNRAFVAEPGQHGPLREAAPTSAVRTRWLEHNRERATAARTLLDLAPSVGIAESETLASGVEALLGIVDSAVRWPSDLG